MVTVLPRANATAITEFQSAIGNPPIGVTPLLNRNCELRDYAEIAVPSFDVDGEFVAYASPESTYAVTKAFIQGARESILIGIYDFTAGYMKELLLQAMRRGVQVSLMLDLDGRTGETPLFEELRTFGCEAVPAPSCANDSVRYFSSSHEKVIVIDDEWSLVQSGNYSENSIPLNEIDGGDPAAFVPGNRDMGLAVQSRPLAAFFRDVLRADMRLTLDGALGQAWLSAAAEEPEIFLLAAAPPSPPPRRFPSRRLTPADPVTITPILSPDNYMDLVPGLLAAAQHSIVVEQQYIRTNQPLIGTILAAIRQAMDLRPHLSVRIIIARPFAGGDTDRDVQEIRQLATKFGLEMGTHVRLLNPDHFVHCHNKLVVIDGETIVLGSQNWSDTAVSKNREAALLLRFPELARYYTDIFDLDWETGVRALPAQLAAEFFAPAALPAGGLVRLSLADYEDV